MELPHSYYPVRSFNVVFFILCFFLSFFLLRHRDHTIFVSERGVSFPSMVFAQWWQLVGCDNYFCTSFLWVPAPITGPPPSWPCPHCSEWLRIQRRQLSFICGNHRKLASLFLPDPLLHTLAWVVRVLPAVTEGLKIATQSNFNGESTADCSNPLRKALRVKKQPYQLFLGYMKSGSAW